MSGKFRFKLESILKLRRQRENAARQSFGVALAERRRIEQSLLRAQSALRSEEFAVRAYLVGDRRDGGEWPVSRARMAELREEIVRLGGRLKVADARLAVERERLLAAMRQRKALGRLKELRLRSHVEQANRRQTFERDDSFSAFTSSRRSWAALDLSAGACEVEP